MTPDAPVTGMVFDDSGAGAGWDSRRRVFTAPFVMAAVNTRVVRRSHALLGFPWADDRWRWAR
jgi:short subunit dehydrogenase-like uncharacterized protein